MSIHQLFGPSTSAAARPPGAGSAGSGPVPSLRRLAAGAAFAVAAALLASCGSSTGPTNLGDSGGNHLVAYSSDRGGSGNFDIYLYDLDNLGFRALPGLNNNGQDDRNPSLSSDGRFIAFESARASTGLDVHVYDRATSSVLSLTGVNTAQQETEPSFTGDAFKLAFVRDTLGYRRIRLIDGRNLNFIPLRGLDTLANYNDFSPGPNYSGSRIAFVSDRLGSNDVFVWDQGQHVVLDIPELRSASADDVDPVMSADGRYVFFASNRVGGQGGYDLYIYDLMDRVFVPLVNVNTPLDERSPTANTSGFILSFQSNRTDGLGGIDIWTHNRGDGRTGNPGQLSSTGSDVTPSIRWP